MIRTTLTALLGLALGTLAAATPTTAATPATTTAATSPDAPAGRVDILSVGYDDGHGDTARHTLRCHPAGGNLPRAAAACGRLDALGGPLGPVPKGEMCSMIYGGPQTARITGNWHGRRVDESYSRSNGCQTRRWQRMTPVLPGPPAPLGTPTPRDASPTPGTPVPPGTPA